MPHSGLWQAQFNNISRLDVSKMSLNSGFQVARVDVCVCTYKRPRLLERLLESLAIQETAQLLEYSVVVVDNDEHASAKPTVRDFLDRLPGLIYDVEPRQNISLARNRALRHCTGEFVAIVDDDQRAEPDWLRRLVEAMAMHRADVVFGRVLRYFERPPPPYVERSRAFEFPNPPTGATSGYTWAGNALIRRSILHNVSGPFDPGFGRTGGGDSDLYLSLRRSGYSMIWCREARVCEFVPRARANWRWIAKRYFRLGNNHDRVHRRPAPPILGLTWRFLNSLALLCAGLASLVFPVAVSKPLIIRLRDCAWNLGRIAYSFGYQYEEYTARSYVVDYSARNTISGKRGTPRSA